MKRKIRCAGRPVSVIVLAGGRGSRMKADKAGLPLPGGTLLERVLGQVGPLFDEVLVSVSPGQKITARYGPAAGACLPDPRTVADERPDLGPLGGILAGLRSAVNDVCAVVACDIPDVHAPLLRKLVRAASDAEIAVPVTAQGKFEPLFAVYTRAVIPKIEELVRHGERSLIPLFGRCRTERVPLGKTGWLLNLNTRADYEKYLKSLRSKSSGGSGSHPENSTRPRKSLKSSFSGPKTGT
ncbi:MAG: molybdenum cofactor guanylyltransferase [Candidatus Aminicenantales bacterium]